MNKSHLFIIALFISFANVSYAEMYYGISPLDSLGNIRSKFPGAAIIKRSPAWASEGDALYELSGAGISGNVMIKFYDLRSMYKKQLLTNADESKKESLQKLINDSDDNSYMVDWIRLVPETKIPLQRLISKYGKDGLSGVSDRDYRPYKKWEKLGVYADLSADEKFVESIVFSPTDSDYKKAYISKGEPIPDWLKDSILKKK